MEEKNGKGIFAGAGRKILFLLGKIPVFVWVALAVVTTVAGIIRKLFFGGGCLMKDFFGIPCPVCGMTRAYASLLTGNLKAAFNFNPAFPAAATAGAFFLMIYIKPKYTKVWVWGFTLSLGVIFAVWIVRLITGNRV